MKKIVVFLGSFKLAITLLILLTLVSIIGVVIPQNLPSSAYTNKWGEFLGHMMLRIGLDHIFSTGWFYLLMILLVLNTLFCSFSRILKKLIVAHKPRFLNGKEGPAGHITTETFLVKPSRKFEKTSRETVEKTIISYFRKNLNRCEIKNERETTQIYAHNGGLKEVFTLIFHLSLVLLMIGGVIARKFGYSYQEYLSKGATVPVRERDFSLRCDWFRLETNLRGEISDYKSKLTILGKDGSEAVSRIIEVNHPLNYNGIKFYQSSYRIDDDEVANIRIRVTGSGLDSRGVELPLRIGETTRLTGTDISVLAKWFIGDFGIDMRTREVFSRSAQPNNPAAKILLLKDRDTLFNSWIFLNHPDFHPSESAYKISLLDFTQPFTTGITIKKDPGTPLIWIGIVLMSFSLYVMFFISVKKRWVFIVDKGTELQLTCISNNESDEYKSWVSKIKGKLDTLYNIHSLKGK